MHNTTYVSYSISRGLPWERLIVIKDRRTHRVIRPTDARGYIKTSDTSRQEFTIEMTAEGGLMLSLTADETIDLPEGNLEFDVVATYPRKSPYTSSSNPITAPVARGTIAVSSLNNITPLEDTQTMEIRFKQHVDFRRNFTWRDDTGSILSVQNAYMQAKGADGTTVLDIRWYSSTPSEGTITGLTGNRRGYIAPATGATLELHISDKNTVPAGVFPFDMFVQDSAGDWDCLASGTIFVEAAVASPPS